MWLIPAAGVIACAAIINAARGGRYAIVSELPGHTRLWAALAFGLLALAWTLDPMKAAKWAGCYLFWAFLPWGRWFDLNHATTLPDRAPSWFERAVEKASGGDDNIAFAIRNALALLPAAILLSPFILALVAVQHGSYALGWAITKSRAIEAAEYFTGLGWGLALILL